MSVQIFVGLATEGPTDIRFFESIVRRTFEDIAIKECQPDIDIYIEPLKTSKHGCSFPDFVVKASREGVNTFGMTTLAIHTDADKDTYDERMNHNIHPAQEKLNNECRDCCKLLTPVIPVRMMEAWMLADTALLKAEIGTNMSDNDLGINRDPEMIADPKQIIEDAIKIAQSNLPKRRHRISISDLYAIIGDKMSLDKLSQLNSYKRFQDEVRNTYRALNYITK